MDVINTTEKKKATLGLTKFTLVCLGLFLAAILLVKTLNQDTNQDTNQGVVIHYDPSQKVAENPQLLQPQSHRDSNQADAVRNGDWIYKNTPQWKFSDGLQAHFESLQQSADAGDNQSRYILAQNLAYCLTRPKNESDYQQRLEEAYEFSDSDAAVERIQAKYAYCQGVEPGHSRSIYSYLKSASEEGYVAAQEAIGRVPANRYMKLQGFEKLERDEFIARRDEFMQRKITYLTQATQHGSITSMIRLSKLYHSQNYGGDGYMKAYALNQLIMELTEDNTLYNRYAWFNQNMHDKLSAAEMQEAIALSKKWYDTVYANGTLYPVTR